MKRVFLLFLAFAAVTAAFAQVRVTTPGTELVLKAENGGTLQVMYFGNRLSDVDFANLEFSGTPNQDAYQAYGFNCASEASIGVTHMDGNMSTVLAIESVTQTDELQQR